MSELHTALKTGLTRWFENSGRQNGSFCLSCWPDHFPLATVNCRWFDSKCQWRWRGKLSTSASTRHTIGNSKTDTGGGLRFWYCTQCTWVYYLLEEAECWTLHWEMDSQLLPDHPERVAYGMARWSGVSKSLGIDWFSALPWSGPCHLSGGTSAAPTEGWRIIPMRNVCCQWWWQGICHWSSRHHRRWYDDTGVTGI